MLSIRTILHPTDFSPGAAVALEHAIHLARHFEAEIHLLHVAPSLGDDPILGAYEASIEDEHFVQQIREEAEAELDALADAHAQAGVPLRRVLAPGVVAGPVIIEYAAENGIDAIVMGTHGRRGVKNLLLGSVAEEVVHRATCHVLTVREQDGPADEARPIQRLLVPIDFTERAKALLQAARDLAGSYGAEVHLLHVIKPLPFAVTLSTPITVQELAPGLADEVRARLHALFAQTAGRETPVEIHVLEGHPARMIAQTARDEDVDLLVIAPSEMTGVERFFLGSVAERVVRTATCPVFVAKGPVLERPGNEEDTASAPSS